MRLHDHADLCRFNSRLIELDLRMCPMTYVKTYHALAVRRLPALTQLDGVAITARDRHHANTRGASISPSVLRTACKFRPLTLSATAAAAQPVPTTRAGVLALASAPGLLVGASKEDGTAAEQRLGVHSSAVSANEELPLSEAVEVVLPARPPPTALSRVPQSCLTCVFFRRDVRAVMTEHL